LTHVSDGYGLRGILDSGALHPTPCPVFDNEPLLYLFYGRPAYRVNSQVLSSGIEAYAPVCFILSPRPTAIRRVFPFDSGAFEHSKLAEAMHHQMILEDFGLEPDMLSPRRLVGLFFGDRDRYYQNQPRTDLALPALEFEATSYQALIGSRHENVFDERISAIEVQVDAPLPLADCEAVVLPDRLADEPEVLRRLTAAGCEVIPYNYIARLRPEAFTSDLYSRVRDYYRRKRFL